jgi:L-ascorbate metabolism protein UlaG (beta-lactamase superfamily)
LVSRSGQTGPTTPSDHFDGERFFNPAGANGRPFSAVPKMIAEKRTPWPVSVPVEPQLPAPLAAGAWAAVTFVGHSTFLIQTRAGHILTDPMFSERASPLRFVGPRRVRRAAVHIADLPPIAVILLSHNHYDHCDLASLKTLARRFDPLLVTPLKNARLVRSAGFRRIEELDWWEQAERSPLGVTAAPAQHFSARTPFDRNRALWSGFVIDVDGRRIFFAGDTGYGGHFRRVRERFGPIDFALLPIGAYQPRWFMKDIHMDPGEAVQAHVDLEARRGIGMHFGTFQLTTEGIDEPIAALDRACRERQISEGQFTVLGFGETMQLND